MAVSARYWRLRATADSFNPNWEGAFQLTRLILRTSPGGTDHAQGQTAVASEESAGNVAGNAVDGNNSTRWSTGAEIIKHWIYVDLGSSMEIVDLAIKELDGASYVNLPQEITIEYGSNGSSWTVLETIAPAETLDMQTFSINSRATGNPRLIDGFNSSLIDGGLIQ